MRNPIVLIIIAFCIALGSSVCALPSDNQNLNYSGSIYAYGISDESPLRNEGSKAAIALLGKDEYYSFCLNVQNNMDEAFSWESASVTVNGGEHWYWSAGSLSSGKSTVFHIYYIDMKALHSEGTYAVDWYFDGQKAYSTQFTLVKHAIDISDFPIPSEAEIKDYNSTNTTRSPYVFGWYDLPADTRYTEYKVDFKAGHLPKGTYCCLGNWKMDYSALNRRYSKVWTESNCVQGYAGFQNIEDGRKVSIMSFWDIFCQDQAGNVTTIRPERIYPADIIGSSGFSGEGTGSRAIVPYHWEADHWYRMHIKCSTSQITGNTVVEQWVIDLETNSETLLCSYDLGVPKAAFIGQIAMFLENYLPQYGGDLRSMQVCNGQYLEESSGKWKPFTDIYLSSNGGAPSYLGSYDFGVSASSIWMITSGVGGDWYGTGRGKSGGYYTVK